MPRRLMKAGVSLMMVTEASLGAIQRPLPVTWSPRRSIAPALALIALIVTPIACCSVAMLRPVASASASSRPRSASSAFMRLISLL